MKLLSVLIFIVVGIVCANASEYFSSFKGLWNKSPKVTTTAAPPPKDYCQLLRNIDLRRSYVNFGRDKTYMQTIKHWQQECSQQRANEREREFNNFHSFGWFCKKNCKQEINNHLNKNFKMNMNELILERRENKIMIEHCSALLLIISNQNYFVAHLEI